MYLHNNEQLIFSFNTASGKHAVLAKDKANGYIVYRYGSESKIELEYPANDATSWKKFTYAYYLRGGGTQNEGMDLNYVSFTNNNFKYVIYYTYYAVGNKSKVGIRIINAQTKKEVNINGINNTVKGTLIDLRGNKLIATSDELYD